jgi:hypothetical protein
MNRDNTRSIDLIESEIAQTRRDIDSTLNEIQSRFTPGQLLDQGLDYLRHSGGKEFVSTFGATVKYNPMPVALAGIGIAWLMASGHHAPPPAGMSGGTGRLSTRMSDAATRVSDAAHASRERLASAGSSVRESASRLGHGIQDGAQSVRRGYQSMLEEQPLLLGALGIALGAALAAALPRSRVEDQVMGDASDRLAEQARRSGEEQLHKAERVAARAAEAAAEEARQKPRPTVGDSGRSPEQRPPGQAQAMQSGGSDSRQQQGRDPF